MELMKTVQTEVARLNSLYARAIESPDGCWLWQGWLDDLGYARIRTGSKHLRAHRVSYELMVAEIPDGLVIDHLCRNRNCVNPYHMEPVTQSVNAERGNKARTAEKTQCKNGHELPEYQGTRRFCNPCRAAATRRHRAKKSK
jgi:hypothetical protein